MKLGPLEKSHPKRFPAFCKTSIRQKGLKPRPWSEGKLFIFIWNNGGSSMMTQGQDERGDSSDTSSHQPPSSTHLHPENSKNDEEGTADDHNVADGFEG